MGLREFLDSLRNVDPGESMLNLGSQIRYGVSPSEKQAIMYKGGFPGARSYLNDPEGAERATSGYLAGKNWGSAGVPMTDIFNRIRQSVITERPELRDIAVNAAQGGADEINIPEMLKRQR